MRTYQRIFHEWFQREMRKQAALDKLADLSKRMMDKLMSPGMSFGNISAYRADVSKKTNRLNMRNLLRDLQKLGYKPIPTYANWTDDKTGKTYQERSFLVPNARPEDIYHLGDKYGQDSVIYKGKNGALNMYYTNDNPRTIRGKPGAAIQVQKSPKKEKGKGPRKKEREKEELYSRTRGLNFSFDFDWDHEYPWDGKTPVDKEGNPDPSELGRPPLRQPKPKKPKALSGWDDYLKKFWQGGKKKVPNTTKTKERFPKVEMLTLMKTDPNFRHRIRQDYKKKVQQERGRI